MKCKKYGTLRFLGAQEQVSYWPEEERRRCAAIIERGSGGGAGGGGGSRQSADGTDMAVSALCSATGLPVAEIARFGVPTSDTALSKIYPRECLPAYAIENSHFSVHENQRYTFVGFTRPLSACSCIGLTCMVPVGTFVVSGNSEYLWSDVF